MWMMLKLCDGMILEESFAIEDLYDYNINTYKNDIPSDSTQLEH